MDRIGGSISAGGTGAAEGADAGAGTSAGGGASTSVVVEEEEEIFWRLAGCSSSLNAGKFLNLHEGSRCLVSHNRKQ